MNDTVCINSVTVEAETEKAILCVCDEWSEKVWIPKSQIDDDSEVYSLKSGETSGTLIITRWIAAQKGLA